MAAHITYNNTRSLHFTLFTVIHLNVCQLTKQKYFANIVNRPARNVLTFTDAKKNTMKFSFQMIKNVTDIKRKQNTDESELSRTKRSCG